MIKLCIEDATLSTLEPSLLPFVQWKTITLSDVTDVSIEIVSANLYKMNKSVIKSLIKNKRVDVTVLTNEQWYDIAEELYLQQDDLFKLVQLPYSVLMYILERPLASNRYATAIARSQEAMPVQFALEHLGVSAINDLLIKNNLPALTDYIFTDEGISQIKKHNNRLTSLVYITSEEAKKLGLDGKQYRNRNIDPRILRRAGACDTGINYCQRILREIGVESITWDEAIKEIRSNPNLQSRVSLLDYMQWIRNNHHMSE